MRYIKAIVGAYLIFMMAVGYICLGAAVYLAFEANVLLGLMLLPTMALPPYYIYHGI